MGDRWALVRTGVILVLVDALFGVLTSVAFFALLGRLPEVPAGLPSLLAAIHGAKTLIWAGVTAWFSRPLHAWLRHRDAAAVSPLRAARIGHRLREFLPAGFAVLWFCVYPICLTLMRRSPALAGLATARTSTATLVLASAAILGAWTLFYTMLDRLLRPTLEQVSLAAANADTHYVSSGLSLRARLSVVALALAAAPTAWLWSFAYATGAHSFDDNFWLAFGLFVLPAVVWALLVAGFFASSITWPLKHVTRHLYSLRREREPAAAPARLPVLQNDEVGKLIENVNDLTERLAAAAEQIEASLGQLKQSADEARAALKVRDDFLSIASHELNTPLAALILTLQVLERQGGGDTAKLSMAVRHAKRMAQLVDNLLNVTRIEDPHNEKRARELVDLAQIVRETGERFLEAARQAGSRLEVEAGAPIPVRCVPLAIEQVVVNLVSNAIKYGDGKPIAVTARTRDAWAELCVEDHGRGMAALDVPRIFKKYERLSEGRRAGGLGLGLYVAASVVAEHGGVIDVDTRLGGPTRFLVRLPLVTDALQS